jgi:hypothetical protein
MRNESTSRCLPREPLGGSTRQGNKYCQLATREQVLNVTYLSKQSGQRCCMASRALVLSQIQPFVLTSLGLIRHRVLQRLCLNQVCKVKYRKLPARPQVFDGILIQRGDGLGKTAPLLAKVLPHCIEAPTGSVGSGREGVKSKYLENGQLDLFRR